MRMPAFTVIFVIFWKITVFLWKFDSLQVKLDLLSSMIGFACEFLNELLNNLTLLWRSSLSYRNQSKSMDWFLFSAMKDLKGSNKLENNRKFSKWVYRPVFSLPSAKQLFWQWHSKLMQSRYQSFVLTQFCLSF